LKFNKMSLSSSKPPSFYKEEAIATLKKYKKSDRNFEIFILKILHESRDYLRLETIREIVSDLQRYSNIRINKERRSDSTD